ncbi:MAG: tetratricopeptide repeat protein, partial [Planctomycetales bacterium]|nr:tetratricopeptide repeat protein [Planctomycetales bacterium]
NSYVPQAQFELARVRQEQQQPVEARKLFENVADSQRNELGARARFMSGELLFSDKQYDAAIREFQRLMYGYGGEKADQSVRNWQARGGLEAGRCAAVLAGQEKDSTKQNELVATAQKYFQYVAEKHPNAEEAAAAKQQLQKIGERGIRR